MSFGGRKRAPNPQWVLFATLRLGVFAFIALILQKASAESDRSPVDLVLGPDESWLATVNQTSDTVSLVRTREGTVLDEVAVGDHPVGIALAPDGRTILVSGHHSGEVT